MSEPEPTRVQLRIKAATGVVSAVALASLVLVDWDDALGRKTVFSGIRPAVKRYFNSAFGVEPRDGKSAQ